MAASKKRLARRAGNHNHNCRVNTCKDLELQTIYPMTENQERTFDAFHDDKHLFLHGVPGSGKTFLAIYLALRAVLEGGDQNKVHIFRSSEPTKNIGFLPGGAAEKMEVYETPYMQTCTKLFGRGDAYKLLKQRDVLEFQSTSYLRGITVDDGIVVVDEAQNLCDNELFAIMTRLGENTRIIFCGDYRQSDLVATKFRDSRGDIKRFKSVIDEMSEFESIEFGIQDCVRSGVVRSFLLKAHEKGYL